MLLAYEYGGHSDFSAFHSVITILIPQCERVNVITKKCKLYFMKTDMPSPKTTYYFKFYWVSLINGFNFKLVLLNFHHMLLIHIWTRNKYWP